MGQALSMLSDAKQYKEYLYAMGEEAYLYAIPPLSV